MPKAAPATRFSEDFFLQALAPMPYVIKAMFGCRMLYRGDQMLCFIMNNMDKYPLDNGVAFAVKLEHQDSLRALFPELRWLRSFGDDGGPGTWLLIPSEAPSFESDLLELAELIKRRDPRIGRDSPSAKKRRSGGGKRGAQKKTAKKKKAGTRTVKRR